MIKFNTWYRAKGPHARGRDDFFYNYFFKPKNNKITYYSVAIHHPDVGEDFTVVGDEDYDYCLENIIKVFNFFEINKRQIIEDCFK